MECKIEVAHLQQPDRRYYSYQNAKSCPDCSTVQGESFKHTLSMNRALILETILHFYDCCKCTHVFMELKTILNSYRKSHHHLPCNEP